MFFIGLRLRAEVFQIPPQTQSPVRCLQPYMTTQNDNIKLRDLLDKAEKMASEYQGGYSGKFLSAKEFHKALFESISKLKTGDTTQLDQLHIWFLPTSCWDDFIGTEGLNLANEISELLSKLTATKSQL